MKKPFDYAAAIAALQEIAKHLRQQRKKYPRSSGRDGLDYRILSDEVERADDLISFLECERDEQNATD